MISYEKRDSVALIRLNRGVTNAIDLESVEELSGILQRVKDDPEVHAVVLGSAIDKFFSIGFDIPQLFNLSRESFGEFYRAFNWMSMDLFVMPKPTVAAITGHAVAGGCILALCCDYRFIAEGRKWMGLNEIKLGVPVPYLADRVLTALVGNRIARDIMEGGEFYSPERALELGLVDQVLPLEQVADKAIEKAEVLGSAPGWAYQMIKRSRVEGVAAEVDLRGEAKEQYFIDNWYSDETRERLRQAMEKF